VNGRCHYLPQPPRFYSFGVFELDGRTGELRRDGVKLKLQDQLFQVLLRLLGRPGEIVSRDELRPALWSDDTFVDFDTGLNTTIKRLRETLGDSADNPIFIETVPRRGHRFIAPVSESGSVPPSLPQRIEVAPKSKAGTGFRLGLAVALTVLLVAFSFKQRKRVRSAPRKDVEFCATHQRRANKGGASSHRWFTHLFL
jgi:DNA-binding winged helix-turn-helix (wHTH) protein